ncbi:type III PLP-dependent enzyme [Lutimaribacter sp. EGI FJ00015]|uniref:Type III PLP-dependent enzyme n=1 Tax=Lutimaribacter degradans TaxID=2945989 RepID=A0ACC5ZZC1_9RHOB|nr:type III PLP-dependent enzyme [Lutimaribacter sp. EGI FJ00013]MCM2563431.1 type III PLP-dependent enzyme [Lutimaribacter sp. EGI FJ00013]MCO0614611.1 type III PLP-dependent enzyme [Lutimaribacter sp. EGI FJ00015]MCO0637282.1 type III PLP-dependent enzyme [Lutimaribacter sp. EGI FJ00014]
MTLNAFVTGPSPALDASLSRAEAHILSHRFERPTLVIDRDAVICRHAALAQGLGRARIHYALKANPAPQLLSALARAGCGFDAASRAEIQLCLDAGATPDRISFGNTIKRADDIAWAHEQGVTLYAADAVEELEKIARRAPRTRVYIRILVMNSQADWPLSRKFGCAPEQALDLMDLATRLGLRPVGLSFHVGSQTRRAAMWAPVLDQVAQVWHAARDGGHALDLLNIGGGFPAFYGEAVDAPELYAAQVMQQVTDRFGDVPNVMAEPGRGLVAEAGAIAAEVLLVSRKSATDLNRWVYLDIGRFSGLAETEGEAIRYQFLTALDGQPTAPCILAGPSCDSADVLYEKRPVDLPLGLAAGDRIVIRNCGAYTSTYASVGFNGFPPLDVVVI